MDFFYYLCFTIAALIVIRSFVYINKKPESKPRECRIEKPEKPVDADEKGLKKVFFGDDTRGLIRVHNGNFDGEDFYIFSPEKFEQDTEWAGDCFSMIDEDEEDE